MAGVMRLWLVECTSPPGKRERKVFVQAWVVMAETERDALREVCRPGHMDTFPKDTWTVAPIEGTVKSMGSRMRDRPAKGG